MTGETQSLLAISKPMMFKHEMRAAIRAGDKVVTRRTLVGSNCRLSAGLFENLDLAPARTVHDLMTSSDAPNPTEIRAPCKFSSGRARNVSIYPVVRPGDYFWLKVGRFGSKAKNDGLIRIEWVGVSRLQDMTDDDAINEGVTHIKPSLRRHGTPRDWFARLWDSINGRGAWQRNPWVWEYYFGRVQE